MRTIIYVVALATAACGGPEPEDAASAQRRAEMKPRYDRLRQQALADDSTLVATSECDAAALADRGNVEALHDRDGEALRLFEASLACKFEPSVAELAFESACEVKDRTRARVHYQQLEVSDDKRELFRAACMTFGVDPVP